MAKQEVKECRTLIKFATLNNEYIEGEDTQGQWQSLSVSLGFDGDIAISTDCFYCEWLGSYGVNAVMQQQNNNILTARVRLPFVQKVYDALTSEKQVRVYKRGRKDEQHTYELTSSADNYLEQGKMLEFQVKRIGGKQ